MEPSLLLGNAPAAQPPAPMPAPLTKTPPESPEPVAVEPAEFEPLEPLCHELGDLSQRPLLVSNVDLEPVMQSAPADPGQMRIRVFIDEQGNVYRVLVDESNLPAALEQAATDEFRKAKYSPGRIGDQAVCSQIRIEITYDALL